MQEKETQDKSHETEKCTHDVGRGCSFSGSGEETQAKACPGCYKLGSTDWLEGFPQMFPDDIVEVRFKNTRKSYYRNVNNLPLKRGDIVAVEASPGHDIGIVSLTGDLVARQMKRVGFNPQNGEFKKIYRKAKPYDIEKWQEAIALEHPTMIRSRQIAAELGLNMKIGDVEYQGDKIKAIFYYIADERVDFRELIKIFAAQFRIRIEMKQIGARQEAGRIGGLGSCGRELCCASWISSFVSVTTNSARHQEISLNPQKLAGQCGKLKCCLIYELDTYLDARKDFPRIKEPLHAQDGDYFLAKTDILSRTMWFSSDPSSMTGLRSLSVDRVKEIIRLNQKGIKVEQLEDAATLNVPAEPTFADVVGEESLTRFDQQSGSSRRKRGGRNRNRDKENNKGEKRTDNRTENREPNGSEASEGKPRENGGERSNGSRNRNRGGRGGAEAARSENRNNRNDRNGDRKDNRTEAENRPAAAASTESLPDRGRENGRGEGDVAREGNRNGARKPRHRGRGGNRTPGEGKPAGDRSPKPGRRSEGGQERAPRDNGSESRNPKTE